MSRLLMVAALALIGPFPSVAAAAEVSLAELAALAERAGDDPSALAQLREVDAVDGMPADIDAALGDVEGKRLKARLARIEAIGGSGSAGSGDPDGLRSSAQGILDEFEDAEAPPESAGEGGLNIGPWGLLAAGIILVLGGLLAFRLAQGRERAFAEKERAEEVEAVLTPDELLEGADRAERAGDFAAALRLRLRWALASLGDHGAIESRSSLSPSQAARQLGDPSANALVRTFERVIYGREEASPDDARAAREQWPEIVSRSAKS